MMVRGEINEVEWPDVPFPLRQYLVLCGRRGSESHGLYVPPTDPNSIDDRDLMGIVIPPASYYLALDTWDHADEIKWPWDVVLYELRKFVFLLCKQNPNVLCMLWLDSMDYLLLDDVGQELIQHRRLFRARKAAFEVFTHYASDQLRRMTSFGESTGHLGAKRKQIVERHGFDTKAAAHLLRLLHMGEEYLRTGELQVRRTWDRDELLAVKAGQIELAEVKRRAEEWSAKCHAAFELSPLPMEIDRQEVAKLLMRTIGPRVCVGVR